MENRNISHFLSTAIPYVNAPPHVGHAFELLIGDALSRHYGQRGHAVRFTGGTDDHSSKNARAAELAGIGTAALVAQHGAAFVELAGALGVAFDDYLHTSSDARHAPAVRELWQRAAARGDLYTQHYSGLYCAGCETFLQESELTKGLCPAHARAPEPTSEQNWFFRLSRYQAPIEAALASGALAILPEERASEVRSFVAEGLRDFSVSRRAERARGWGIAVPGDPSQVIYVWFDALANYLSLLGFPEPNADFERYWLTASAREHVIGKDILRFHAVYWPGILLSAGLPLPTSLRVHGFLTAEGRKIGKSLGNALEPLALIERYGRSAVRYFFLRHLHSTKDSDFRLERLVEAHDAELSAKLGNLALRVSTLCARHAELDFTLSGPAPHALEQSSLSLREAAARAHSDVARAADELALHQALASIIELAAAANRYADETAPWQLSKRALSGDPEARSTLQHALSELLEALRICALLLWPFLPDPAETLQAQLGLPSSQLKNYELAAWGQNKTEPAPQKSSPLFPKLAESNHRAR